MKCVICGRPFVPKHHADIATCSPEHREIRKRNVARIAQQRMRDKRKLCKSEVKHRVLGVEHMDRETEAGWKTYMLTEPSYFREIFGVEPTQRNIDLVWKDHIATGLWEFEL